jgi:hypothetical protein
MLLKAAETDDFSPKAEYGIGKNSLEKAVFFSLIFSKIYFRDRGGKNHPFFSVQFPKGIKYLKSFATEYYGRRRSIIDPVDLNRN